MATARQWVSAARPRTFPAALAPVLVGTGAAAAQDAARTDRALVCLVVALALQVGVNYANDYSDGVRGTDDDRVGPFRLTGSGAARPGNVRTAAFGAFLVAALAGLGLVALTEAYWMLVVGVACIAAAWYYTGGERPYGYSGLGEVFVFVFFGLVAVLGTTYVQTGGCSVVALLGAVGTGALACAILLVNNLRDLATDALAGKRTLSVRIGDAASRRLYAGLLAAALLAGLLCAPWHPGALAVLLAVPVARRPLAAVRSGASGRDLLPALQQTGQLELVYAVLLTAGLWLL